MCCGTGTNATVCKDLSADQQNCGASGQECAGTQSCHSQTSGTVTSGTCGCSTGSQCPTGQSCRTTSDLCDCEGSSSTCASGQTCVVVGSAADFCAY